MSGKPRLLSRRCETCVFRAHNPMRLAPGRFADLVASNRATGSMLICHDTLPYGAHPEFGKAMCRGFFDAYAETSEVAWLTAWAFGPDWYEEVDPPGSTREDVNGTVGGDSSTTNEELT